MKKQIKIVVVFASSFLISCSSSLTRTVDTGEIKGTIDFPACDQVKDHTLGGLVIKDTNDLDVITSCNTNNLYIDFDEYSILGLYANGRCRLILDRNVSINPNSKTYTYKIKSRDRGLCESYVFSHNFVKVPAIPDDYSVNFILED